MWTSRNVQEAPIRTPEDPARWGTGGGGNAGGGGGDAGGGGGRDAGGGYQAIEQEEMRASGAISASKASPKQPALTMQMQNQLPMQQLPGFEIRILWHPHFHTNCETSSSVEFWSIIWKYIYGKTSNYIVFHCHAFSALHLVAWRNYRSLPLAATMRLDPTEHFSIENLVTNVCVLGLFWATVRQLPAVLPLCLFTSTLQSSNFHLTYKTGILSWSLCSRSCPKPRVKLEWQKVSSNLKLLGRPDQINPLIASCKGRISILRQRRSLHAWDCQHVTGNRCHLIKWRLC